MWSNTAKQCRLGLFQDSDFAGDLEDSKSTSGRTLCIFGSHTLVPISWMCKKQTSVSHSSKESEIISLHAGLRLDGIPALDFWDLIVAVLGNTNQSHKERGDSLMNKREVRSTPHTIQKRKQSQGVINDLDNVDFISSLRTCLPLLHQKAWEKTRYGSQLPLRSLNEQHQRTVRLVLDAYSSSYSEWNIDEKWSSQEWKSDELMEVRTGRLVFEQSPGLFTQHTDKFIVDDDDMDSDTVVESDM